MPPVDDQTLDDERQEEQPKELDLREEIAQAVAQQKGEAEETPAPREPREPKAEGQAQEAGQARDAQGRFAKSEEQAAAPRQGQQPPQQPQQAEGPPHGWSAAAKARFNALPAEVRAAVAQRETEVNQGLARLQYYADVDQYAQAAVRSGTTLAEALRNYTGIENMLRSDPAGGLIEIMSHIPMNVVTVLKEVVRRLGGQPTDGQAPMMQPGPAAMQPNGQIHPAIAEHMRLTTQFMQDSVNANYQQHLGMARREVADFWASHPYAENVAGVMLGLIKQAQDYGNQTPSLQEAYDLAVWMVPEVRELLINQRSSPSLASNRAKALEASRMARAANKATTGAPAGGSTLPSSAPPPNASLREVIQHAIDSQR